MIGSLFLMVTGALIGIRLGYLRMAGDVVGLTCWTLTGTLAGGAIGELLTSFRRGHLQAHATAPSSPPGSYQPEFVRRPGVDVDKTLEMDKQQASQQTEVTVPIETSEHPPITVQRSRRRLV